jgi:elongation factor G
MGLMFKTLSEPGMGQMNYVRVYSGKITPGDEIINITKNTRERSGQLSFLQGKKRFDTQEIQAGDMGVIIKLKETKTNDIVFTTGFDKSKLTTFEQIKFPTPLYDMAIYPKSKGEEEKVGTALNSMTLEDPTLKQHFNPETKEMIISGLGNLQLEVILNRIKSRYNVDVELRTPRLAYKETIKGTAKVQHKHKKQSGGRGQYGDCWLQIEPLGHGKGFEFVDKIFGGSIPKNYIPSVEKGVVNAMAEGAVAGYPIVDVKVSLIDGSYHEVDSSDMAFQIAGGMALKKGIAEANPIILEPIMNLEAIVNDEYLGAIMGDMNGRRGRVLGMERIKNKQVVKTTVPLVEVIHYATDLRSLTKGSGKFKMSFSHYEEVPTYLAQPLIDQYKKKQEEGR